MKYIFKIAVKNLLKEKRRTILSFLMLSFGVAFYIFIAGMLEGIDQLSINNIINFSTGHLKIRSSAFNEDYPFDAEGRITDYEKVISEINRLPEITGTTPRLNITTEADNGQDTLPVITIGIDAIRDQSVFNLMEYITIGSLEKNGCLIGKQLSEDMKLSMGDVLYNSFKTSSGMINSIELTVCGIISCPDPLINNMAIIMKLDELQNQSGINSISEIAVKTKSSNLAKSMAEKIKDLFPGMNVKTWHEEAADLAAVTTMKKKGSSVIILFMMIIAMVGILNTMIISVYQQQRIIGTMKALGMTDSEVKYIFLIEGAVIGIAGCFSGIVAGCLINLYFVTFGIDINAFSTSGTSVMSNVGGVVKSTWPLTQIFAITILSFAASIIASYFPASKVVKLKPVECLRINQ